MRDYRRLDAFLDALRGDLYAEPPTEPHLTITRLTIEGFLKHGVLKADQEVLDIGCGQGLALECLKERGIMARGVTLGPDVAICREKDLPVAEMDQSFLSYEPESFDFLWARHVLEHSPFPLFTLSEYRRILKPGGFAYVEVPAPETDVHHEYNPNHYSVLTMLSWLSLFDRAGLPTVADTNIIEMTLPSGASDRYYGFLLRKRADA